jgi:signal peptidase II
VSQRRLLLLALATAAIVLLVDQATKLWARASLPYDRFVPVIPHWFGWGLISNTGAAFGSLSGRNGLLTIATSVLLVVIVLLLVRGTLSDPLTALALGALLGGGLSNLLDRLRLASVVDFIEFRPWPSDFNLADVAIRAGALALVVSLVIHELRRPRSA